MATQLQTPFQPPRIARALFVFAALTGLAACASDSAGNVADGIGFREARFQEITATREYRECRDQALDMDRKARVSGSAGAYLTSARVLEKCETALDESNHGVSTGDRMQAYALASQNHFKGGDIDAARRTFTQFKKSFPDNDLYYVDGTSFIATMEALLGQAEPWTFGEFAALNVNGELKSEMRRMNYWKRK